MKSIIPTLFLYHLIYIPIKLPHHIGRSPHETFLNPTPQVFNRNGEVFRPKVRIFLAPKFVSVGPRMNYSALLHYWTEVDVFEADPSEWELGIIIVVAEF